MRPFLVVSNFKHKLKTQNKLKQSDIFRYDIDKFNDNEKSRKF